MLEFIPYGFEVSQWPGMEYGYVILLGYFFQKREREIERDSCQDLLHFNFALVRKFKQPIFPCFFVQVYPQGQCKVYFFPFIGGGTSTFLLFSLLSSFIFILFWCFFI
jgi:hypothetical protein